MTYLLIFGRFILGMLPVILIGILLVRACFPFKNMSKIIKIIISFGWGIGITTCLMLIIGLLPGEFLNTQTILLSQASISILVIVFLKKREKTGLYTLLKSVFLDPMKSIHESSRSIVSRIVSLNQTNFLILMVVGISFSLILYQTTLFPMIGWDTYSFWASRAKLIFQHSRIICMPPSTPYEINLHPHPGSQPPLYILALSYAFFQVGTVDLFVPHIINGLFGLGAVLTLCFFGRSLFGKQIGFLTLFLALCTPIWFFESIRVDGDIPFAFYMILMVYLLYCFLKEKVKTTSSGIAVGITGALAGLVKTEGILLFVALVLFYCIYMIRLKKRNDAEKISVLFLPLLMFFIPLFLWCTRIFILDYNAQIQPGIFGSGIVQRLFNAAFGHGPYYYDRGIYALRDIQFPKLSFFQTVGSIFENLFFNTTMGVSFTIFAISMLGLLVLLYQRKFSKLGFLLCFIIFPSVPLLIVYESSDTIRYFMPEVLLMIIFGAYGFAWLLEKTTKFLNNQSSKLVFYAIFFLILFNFALRKEMIFSLWLVVSFTIFVSLATLLKSILTIAVSRKNVYLRNRKFFGSLFALFAIIILIANRWTIAQNAIASIPSPYFSYYGGGTFFNPFASIETKMDNPMTGYSFKCARFINSQSSNVVLLYRDMNLPFFIDTNHVKMIPLVYVYDEILAASTEEKIVEYLLTLKVTHVQLGSKLYYDGILSFILTSENFVRVFETEYGWSIFKIENVN